MDMPAADPKGRKGASDKKHLQRSAQGPGLVTSVSKYMQQSAARRYGILHTGLKLCSFFTELIMASGITPLELATLLSLCDA